MESAKGQWDAAEFSVLIKSAHGNEGDDAMRYPQFQFNNRGQEAKPHRAPSSFNTPDQPSPAPADSTVSKSSGKVLHIPDLDGERLALLALLYLLYREGTDVKLLLAIAYIFL